MFYATSLHVIYVSNTLWNKDNVSSSIDMFTNSDNIRGFYKIGEGEDEQVKYYPYRSSNVTDTDKNVANTGSGGYLTSSTIVDKITKILDYMIDISKFNDTKGLFRQNVDADVTSIIFGKSTDEKYSTIITGDGVDITKSQTGKVKLYHSGTTVYVLSDDTIYFDFFSQFMFTGLPNLATIEFDNINTSMVRRFKEMFAGCTSLTTIYASADFDIGNQDSQYDSGVFDGCSSLKASCDGSYFSHNDGRLSVVYAKIYRGDTNLGYFTNISLKPTTTS